MCVSLYANGPVRMEIGKYGKSLYKAKEDFNERCIRLGLGVEEKPTYKGCELRIQNMQEEEPHSYDERLKSLLHELAYVDNWRASPPTVYLMSEEIVPEDDYVKIGIYDTQGLTTARIL